jgi:hypothetical protein
VQSKKSVGRRDGRTTRRHDRACNEPREQRRLFIPSQGPAACGDHCGERAAPGIGARAKCRTTTTENGSAAGGRDNSASHRAGEAAHPAPCAAARRGTGAAESHGDGTDPEHHTCSGGISTRAAGPPAQAAGELTVPGAVVNATPTLRVGEVLEVTPGLIVSQHSGEGKANQYFLRGFALDHGTDFAVNVDGMPINMPTHGHGQGYTTSIS